MIKATGKELALKRPGKGIIAPPKKVNMEMDQVVMDTHGFSGEFAFGKLFNCFPFFDSTPEQIRMRKYDLNYRDKRIDVKSIQNQNHNLIIPFHHTGECIDVYALMYGDVFLSNVFVFYGFIKMADALTERYVRDVGYGPCYRIPKSDLKNFEELRF